METLSYPNYSSSFNFEYGEINSTQSKPSHLTLLLFILLVGLIILFFMEQHNTTMKEE